MTATATLLQAPPPLARGTPPPPITPEETGRASADGLRVAEFTYWTEYYLDPDHRYEWNNGRLEEKPVSDHATYLVYLWLLELLRHYLRTQAIAQVVGLEMGFRLLLPTGVVIRRPDLAVVRNDNPNPLLPLDVSYHGVFDLCVEALSDQDKQDRDRDLVVKRGEYAAGGVPEYFVVHHEPELQAFFRLGAGGVYVPVQPEDGVISSRVLPGFRFRQSDLTDQRPPEVLCQDPVYSDFVLPAWRALEQRADAEAARADAEAARADAESARADAEAARADAEAAARQAAEQELAALRARFTGD